jgi:hypothetical protein
VDVNTCEFHYVYVEYNEQCQQGDPWPDTIIMQMLTLTPPSESVYGSQFFDAKLLQVTKEVVH